MIRRHDRPRRCRLALHLAALTAFAVAQPLYDLVARSPEFFVAHRADRADIAILTVLLLLALPAAVMLGVRLLDTVSTRVGTALGLAAVLALAAAFALLVLKRTTGLASPAALPIALGLAAAATLAYDRFEPVRSFTSVLAAGIVVFPLLFLFQPSVRQLLAGPATSRAAVTPAARPATVVFVVFDQFPLASLLDSSGQIETAAYPSFAALAARSTWYRNATTVNPVTGWSIPAMLTGRRPKPADLPVASSHPNSLFTLLAPTHRMHVVEPITDLCPDDLCPPPRDPPLERARAMASDLGVVYLHTILPVDLARGLPSVTQDWKDFAAGLNWQRRFGHRDEERRHAVWEDFLSGIHGGGGPVLHYVHVLLPHDPYVYLPSGARYTSESTMPGLSASYWWGPDPWLVTQAYQRQLLQVAFTDRLLGRLLARLREQGLLDQSLLVVTGDHGAGFRPEGPLRNVDPRQFAAIMSVPMFIKRPYQREGVLDDGNAETVDILPTVAEALGARVPWRMDGTPLSGPRRAEKEFSYERVKVTRRLDPVSLWEGVLAIAAHKRELFGEANGPFRFPRTAPAAELVGQPAAELAGPALPGAARVTLDQPEAFEAVDPASGRLPARITGGLAWPGGPRVVTLAVALNGVVRATTMARPGADGGRWSVVVPESSFRPGKNEVTVYLVSGSGNGGRLSPAASSD